MTNRAGLSTTLSSEPTFVDNSAPEIGYIRFHENAEVIFLTSIENSKVGFNKYDKKAVVASISSSNEF